MSQSSCLHEILEIAAITSKICEAYFISLYKSFKLYENCINTAKQ